MPTDKERQILRDRRLDELVELVKTVNRKLDSLLKGGKKDEPKSR